MGLADGCRVKRDIAKDTVLTFADVTVPAGRKIDAYYAEMERHFGLVTAEATV
jgi:predicted homoserine dehydrogenase-like protein